MILPNASEVGRSALTYVKQEWQSLAKIFAPSLTLSVVASLLPLFALQTPESLESVSSIIMSVAFLSFVLQIAAAIASVINSFTAFRFIHGHITKQPLSIEQARDWSGQDFFRYVRSIIVIALYIFALVIGIGVIVALLFMIGKNMQDVFGNFLLGTLGILVLLASLIAILYFSTMFVSVQYNSIIEKKNGFPSVQESMRLTKPYRFSLFGKLLWSELTIFFGILFTPAILVICLLVASLAFVHIPLAMILADAFSSILLLVPFSAAVTHINLQYVLAMKKG